MDEWSNIRDELRDITNAIDDARYELEDLLEHRAELVEQAADEGMPQREIGFELGVSHTTVQRILAGQDALRALRGVA
jgi:Trp operon repressor